MYNTKSNDSVLKVMNYVKSLIMYCQFILQKDKAKLPGYHIPVSKYSNYFAIFAILLFFSPLITLYLFSYW